VEFFLAPLTARSKVREVLRGLVATRQVHTIALGHAPHFYVAGTLPEFAAPPTAYASASMPASAYFMHSQDEEIPEPVETKPVEAVAEAVAAKPAESFAPRTAPAHNPAAGGKAAARPHFSRPARRTGADSRPASSRTAAGAHKSSSARPAGGNGHSAARPANGSSSAASSRTAKPGAPAWGPRNGHSSGKPTGASSAAPRNGGSGPRGPRQDSRPDARSSRSASTRKPALTAGAKAGNGKRFGFAARSKQGTEKRG